MELEKAMNDPRKHFKDSSSKVLVAQEQTVGWSSGHRREYNTAGGEAAGNGCERTGLYHVCYLPDARPVLPNWLMMWHSSGHSLLMWVLGRHGLGRTPHPTALLPDLQLLLSSTSTCHRWETAGTGKCEASDPSALFFQLRAGSSTVLDILVQDKGICCGTARSFPRQLGRVLPSLAAARPSPGRSSRAAGEPRAARLRSPPLPGAGRVYRTTL